ncbi:hypothetical protein O9993_09115 [Vibrio lentus]|nr:hypothetical protein [Vibrio lentus]
MGRVRNYCKLIYWRSLMYYTSQLRRWVFHVVDDGGADEDLEAIL